MSDPDVPEIVAVSLDRRQVQLAGGEICPITNMFVGGLETNDPDDEITAVVVALPTGKWLASQIFEDDPEIPIN